MGKKEAKQEIEVTAGSFTKAITAVMNKVQAFRGKEPVSAKTTGYIKLGLTSVVAIAVAFGAGPALDTALSLLTLLGS